MSRTYQSWVPLPAKMRSVLIFSLLSCFFAAYNAKVFSKCELARKLKDQGMDGFHGYSLANCEYELLTCAFCLCPEGLFPNPEISPFSLHDFLSFQGSLTLPCLLFLSLSPLPSNSYLVFLFSISTRDVLLLLSQSPSPPMAWIVSLDMTKD